MVLLPVSYLKVFPGTGGIGRNAKLPLFFQLVEMLCWPFLDKVKCGVQGPQLELRETTQKLNPAMRHIIPEQLYVDFSFQGTFIFRVCCLIN